MNYMRQLLEKARKGIIIAIMCTGCTEGRWVGGNAKHFQQRADKKIITIKTTDNGKQ